MPGNDCLARGSVIVNDDVTHVGNATVYVRLEDVSRADAPSQIIAQQVLSGAAFGPGAPLRFEIRGALPGGSRDCRLRVHVDVDGDGQISPGDLVSTQSYTVTPMTAQQDVQIRVQRV